MAHETRWVSTPDGLRLNICAWRGGSKTPVLCIPGLTRNAADFEDLAPLLAATGRDVYAISLRGRGRSDRDPSYLNYFPTTYVGDVVGALDQLSLPRAVFIGTSLGGIVTMLTAAEAPMRVAAAIINDVGPELAPEGVGRIASYVGARAEEGAAPVVDFDAAVSYIRSINETAFPGRDDEFWAAFARRTFDPQPDGSWRLNYDPTIGRALAESGPAPDLWPAFASLKSIPTLIIRGELSDLLSRDIVDKMRSARPGFEYCEVQTVGHAPMMTEPDAWRAIAAFLDRVD